jgi:hypothetical protein
VHPSTIIVFFANLRQNYLFFILIHLLYASTCFEHYYAHPQEVKIALSTAFGAITLEISESRCETSKTSISLEDHQNKIVQK